MAGAQVLEQRAGAQQNAAGQQAYEEDMDERGGLDTACARKTFGRCQGTYEAWRVSICVHGSRYLGSEGVCGEKDWWHVALQGFVRCRGYCTLYR